MPVSEAVRYSPGDHDHYPLRRYAGVFRDPVQERLFQRHHLQRNQAQLRITLTFCACFYVVFALTDVAMLGYTVAALGLFGARVLVALSAATALFLIARYPQSIIMPRIAATIAEVVGMAAFMPIVWLRPEELSWHTTSLGIMLSVVYLFIPNTFWIAAVVAISTTVAYVLLVLSIGLLSVPELLIMTMLLILANGFGIIAALRYENLLRNEFIAQASLKNLSYLDHLTGCYNRRYMEEHLLAHEVDRACRYPAWLTVIMCDLDYFKTINDTYGHPVGDAVLQHFAVLLQDACRAHVDSVIRYGGEEFMLILPETDLKGGIAMAERMRAMLASGPVCRMGKHDIMITGSFGVGAVNFSAANAGANPQALIAHVDELLYRAKQAGRDRIEFAEFCPQSAVLQPVISPMASQMI